MTGTTLSQGRPAAGARQGGPVVVSGSDESCADDVVAILAEGGLPAVRGPVEAPDLAADGVLSCAVVLVDEAPRFASAQQVRDLVDLGADVPVIVVAEDASSLGVRSAVRAGASGFVAANRVGDTLAATVRAVLAGQVVVPREQRGEFHGQILTTREKQALALVVMGFTNGEIAAKLFLAESTVKSHLSSAFQKLGVRSRNEAAAMIVDPKSGVGPGILTIPTQDR